MLSSSEWPRRICFGALIALVLLAAPAASQAVTDPFTFGAPALIAPGPPYAQQLQINGISCPSTSLCVAVDNENGTVSTSDPTDASPTWSGHLTIDDGEPRGVSCPTTSLCVAIDGRGRAITTLPRRALAALARHAHESATFKLAFHDANGSRSVLARTGTLKARR